MNICRSITRSTSYARSAVVAGAILSAAMVSQVSAAPTEFRALDVKLKILTQECDSFGWSIGDHTASVRFRPAGLKENGTRTYLALHFYYWAERYYRDEPKIGSGYNEYSGGGLAATFFDFAIPTPIKFNIKTDGKLNNKTKKLTATVRFKDFDGVAGCEAKFKTKMKKRET